MGVNCCDVCELAGFCQFMNEHEIEQYFPNLNPFCACLCDSTTDYQEHIKKEVERLKSGVTNENRS